MTASECRTEGTWSCPPQRVKKWLDLSDGGAVEIADLGDALVIVRAGRGGLRAIVRAAIDDAGGYRKLADAVGAEEPDLA